jgi:hypothetical protein
MVGDIPRPLLLDTNAVARLTGIDARRWADLRRAGLGPPTLRLGPRQVVYVRDLLEQWLQENARTQQPSSSKAKPPVTANDQGLNSNLPTRKAQHRDT